MIRAADRRFLADEHGAIAYMVMVGAVPLSLLMLMIANTGGGMQDRSRAQEGADALALTHATWAARSLNTMSMNNVALTQAASVGIISSSLSDAIHMLYAKAAITAIELTANAFKECELFAAWYLVFYEVGLGVCAADHVYMGSAALEAVLSMQQIDSKYDPAHGTKTAERAINALNAMNAALIDRFPEAVHRAALPIARASRIADFYFDEPCSGNRAESCRNDQSRQGMDLPVEDGDIKTRLRFCAAMFYGGTEIFHTSFMARGFERGEGPYEYGGDDQYPNLKDFANHETGIGKVLEEYYEFYDENEMLCGIVNPGWYWFVVGFGQHKWGVCDKVNQSIIGGNYGNEQTEDENNFTRIVDFRKNKLCVFSAVTNPIAKSLGLEWLDAFLSGIPDPDFYRLPQNANAFMPMAITFRKPAARWAPKALREPMPGTYSYGQALIFNDDAEDLYSQNWRARMMPATRMDDIEAVRQRMGDRAPKSFDSLVGYFKQVKDFEGWRQLNVK